MSYICDLLYKKTQKKTTRKHYLNMAEKMLRNVSDLMLASVSHYEILEGERVGPKFASIRTAVFLLFFFLCGGVLVNTAQLICLFVQGLL